MRPRTLLALTAVAALGAVILGANLDPRVSRPEPVTLATVDGRHLRLGGPASGPVLAVFWSTTCGVCLEELPHLVDLHRRLEDVGGRVVAVSLPGDPPARVMAMGAALGLPYPFAMDVGGEATRAFGGVRVTPTAFLLAPDGRVAQRLVGRFDPAMVAKRAAAIPSPTQWGRPGGGGIGLDYGRKKDE